MSQQNISLPPGKIPFFDLVEQYAKTNSLKLWTEEQAASFMEQTRKAELCLRRQKLGAIKNLICTLSPAFLLVSIAFLLCYVIGYLLLISDQFSKESQGRIIIFGGSFWAICFFILYYLSRKFSAKVNFDKEIEWEMVPRRNFQNACRGFDSPWKNHPDWKNASLSFIKGGTEVNFSAFYHPHENKVVIFAAPLSNLHESNFPRLKYCIGQTTFDGEVPLV